MGTSRPHATEEKPVAKATPNDNDNGDAELRIDIGLMVAHSPGSSPDRLTSFATGIAGTVVDELASATDAVWRFYMSTASQLANRSQHRPSAFLDEAAIRMVDGPYDLLVVITDVPLQSRSRRLVPGLSSSLSRVAVVSTHRLLVGHRDEPIRTLESDAVHWNAAALLLHLLGHVMGASHTNTDSGTHTNTHSSTSEDSAMAPFEFDPGRREIPQFDIYAERYLERVAKRLPEEKSTRRGPINRLGFHILSAIRNPDQVVGALVQSRAFRLPLSLPKLSTAAVTPTLIVVFSAESWDVGINLTDASAVLFAVTSILVAAVYLMYSLNLFFPRKRHQTITEHMALVNVTSFLILLAGMIGLFVLVWTIMLVIELVVFPPNLMTNWPSLEDPTVGLHELVRTGAFIATIGVLTGALAGGLEDRSVLRHLALFRDRP